MIRFTKRLVCLSLSTLALAAVAFAQAPGSDFDNSRQQQEDYCSQLPTRLGSNSQLEYSIHQLVNQQRAEQGKLALRLNSLLNVAAQKHAINMGCQGNMSHELDGQNAGDRMRDAGYSWSAWAENIAQGYPGASTVVTGWMNSPGHRDNILDANDLDFTETGIGAFRGPDGTLYFCQVFGRPVSGKQG